MEWDFVHPRCGGQVELGLFLVWFAIVYGNLNVLVIGVVLLSLWAKSASGVARCASWNLSPIGCQVSLVVLCTVVLGTSTVLSLKRLLDIRKRRDK